MDLSPWESQNALHAARVSKIKRLISTVDGNRVDPDGLADFLAQEMVPQVTLANLEAGMTAFTAPQPPRRK